MRAGTLRHVITLQSSVTVKDPKTGIITTSWVDFRKVRASIEQMKSWDKQALAATFPGADSVVKIRYMAGVLPTMRISHGAGCPCGIAAEEIISVIGKPNDVDGRHRELIINGQSGVKNS